MTVIYMVTHKYVCLGQQMRNVFYYDETAGPPTTAEWQDSADEIRADWVAEMQAQMVNDISLYGISYRNVYAAGHLSKDLTFTAGPVAGSSATQPLPTQVSLLVSNKGDTTKPNRARSYLAGFHISQVLDSQWVSSAINAAEAFIDLQSDLNAGGTFPLQRVAVQWNSSHTNIITSNDISGAVSVASTIPATQRRRRIGVGI